MYHSIVLDYLFLYIYTFYIYILYIYTFIHFIVDCEWYISVF